MSANLGLLGREPLAVLGLALGLMAVKFALMALVSRVAGAPWASALAVGDAVSQGGEFAFVLFGAAAGFGVLAGPVAERLVLAVTLSLVISPLVFALHDRLLASCRNTTRSTIPASR
jgi:Kef-type K+ transport system membrane component KefB